MNGISLSRIRCAMSGESKIIRPLLRVSSDMASLPPPMFILARSHGVPGDVDVDDSARWRSSVHSSGVMKLSITAANLSLKAGIEAEGVVFVRSMRRTWAPLGAPRRNALGICTGGMVMVL